MEPSSNGITFAERLVEAGGEIIAMESGLGIAESRAMLLRGSIQGSRMHGLAGLPSPETPLEIRYAIIGTTLGLLDAELALRDIAPPVREKISRELDAFYRRIRGMDSQGPA